MLPQSSPHQIGLISDALTAACVSLEADVVQISPLDPFLPWRAFKPDLLLVESAWEGHRGRWKYKVASYPRNVKCRNVALARVVARARDQGIPTVFWNKEDGVHFERFIESAKLFDHIFTVDENCIPRYRAVVPESTTVNTLMFGAQPALHGFTGIAPKFPRANFVGSYSRHIHPARRELQHMLFETAATELGLTVFDRNSGRRSSNYRYPAQIPMEVRPAVPHAATAQIYRDYLVSLNVNTVQDSPTMFSRRLIEILACGGLAVTTPALSVDRLFAPYCHVIRSADQARELFGRLARDGLSKHDREMIAAGTEHVLAHHTWKHRLRQIFDVVTAGA